MADWVDLGAVESFKDKPLHKVQVGKHPVALSYRDGKFGAVSSVCNHVGGPLADGKLDGEYLECPWHSWKFHRSTGEGEPGFESDCVPRYDVKVEKGHVFVSAEAVTKRHKSSHAPHPLARPVKREEGPIRVVGISTTAMDPKHPRVSTSEILLQVALDHAKSIQCETRLLRLSDLKFRACEGYYSKAARACTWPCSITQMDDKDEMTPVYDALVHWADVLVLATPIRWGAASSLYFKMAERLNCVQNQVTIKDTVLIKNKVASFIITGGQDNIQGVAGQMLGFFSELGFSFPQFPFIAHSRGWTAEDMEKNVCQVAESEELRAGARSLVDRSVQLSRTLLGNPTEHFERGGRKACRLEVERS